MTNFIAEIHAAHHRAALLLERCSQEQQPAAMPQAQWQTDQQARYLAWLQAGGFAQGEPPIENSGTEPLFSVPQGDSNEESKFTLVRINDAVE